MSSFPRCDANVLLAAVTALSAAVAFVAALHLYARCLLRRRAAVANPHSTQLPPDGYEVEIVSVAGGGGACGGREAGLDAKALRALPVFVWEEEEEGVAGDGERGQCAVCLGEMEDGELGRLLPACRHVFHVECIDAWLAVTSTCPVCRTTAAAAAADGGGGGGRRRGQAG
ncbi:hypothetical protein ACP70R_040846 [Stipagrostis hirtigluma subsp. patula]